MWITNLFGNLRLKAKFSLVITTLVVIVVVSILIVVYQQEKGIILGGAKRRALDLAAMLAFSSVPTVVMDKYLELQQLVDSISDRTGVMQVMVLDNQGKVLAHNHTIEIGKRYRDEPSLQAVKTQYPLSILRTEGGVRLMDVSVPVWVGREKKATARVLFSLKEAYSSLQKIAYSIVLIGFIGIGASIVFALFLARIITQPIRQLLLGVRRIREGDLRVRASIKYRDETGELGEAFNRMVEDIATLEERIRHSERLTSLGLTAASIAHEVKSPLTSIKTFVELLPQKHQDPVFREKFQENVLPEINRLNNLVNDLLNFSKERKPQLQQININDMITYLVSLLKEKTENSEIRITTRLTDLPDIYADKDQLLEAFLNIAQNAVEAVAGKGELHIETESAVKNGSPKVKIFFSDNGRGIPKEDLDRIFDPFFSTKSKGIGLGLAISRKAIEAHQGSIRVKSQQGKGTTFEIILPSRITENTEGV